MTCWAAWVCEQSQLTGLGSWLISHTPPFNLPCPPFFHPCISQVNLRSDASQGTTHHVILHLGALSMSHEGFSASPCETESQSVQPAPVYRESHLIRMKFPGKPHLCPQPLRLYIWTSWLKFTCLGSCSVPCQSLANGGPKTE